MPEQPALRQEDFAPYTEGLQPGTIDIEMDEETDHQPRVARQDAASENGATPHQEDDFAALFNAAFGLGPATASSTTSP